MAGFLHQLSAVCLAFLGTLFLYSGLAKLLSQPTFRLGLGRIPYLSRGLLPGLAWAIPIGEILIGVGVMGGMIWAIVAAIFMLTGFSIVAAVAHRHDQEVPCNCFGVDASEKLSLRTVWRNACLVGIATVILVFPPIEITPLSGVYGAIAFVLFLAVVKTVRNQLEFANGSENLHS